MATNAYAKLATAKPYQPVVSTLEQRKAILGLSNTKLNLNLSTENKTSTQAMTTGGMELTPVAVAKNIVQGVARSGASVGLTLASPFTGIENTENLDPEKKKRFEILFGKEPIKTLQTRIAENTPTAEKISAKFGFPKESAPFSTALVIGALVGLDFTGLGGEANLIKAIPKITKIAEAEKLLKSINVAEDLIPDYAKFVVRAKTTKEAEALIGNLKKIQETTKVAQPVAKETSPLIQEAKKYKSAEEFVNKFDTKAVYKNTYESKFDNKPAEVFRSGESINGHIDKGGEAWFTTGKSDAMAFSDKTHPTYSAYLDMKNPLDLRANEGLNSMESMKKITEITGEKINSITELSGEGRNKLVSYAKNKGYDGLITPDTDVSGKNIIESFVVWNKNQIKTKSQLTDIWNEGNKIKTPEGGVKKVPYDYEATKINAETTPLQQSQKEYSGLNQTKPEDSLKSEIQIKTTKPEILPNSSYKKSIQENIIKSKQAQITRAEDVLLRERFRNQARGARAGYKIGQQEAKTSITNQLKNTFETKIEDIKRSNELGALKTNIKTRDWDRVKNEIVEYTKSNIPISERGAFLNMVKDAKTQNDLIKAFVRIDRKSEEVVLNRSINNLKNIVGKLTESPSVAVDYRNKIKDIIGEYELKGHQQSTIDKLKATQEYLDKMKLAGKETEMPQRILDKLKILSRTPKNKLTLSQVQGLQNEVELFGQLGKTKWATKQALYDGEKELRKIILLKTSTPIKGATLPIKEIGEKNSKWIEFYVKARNYLQKTKVSLTPMDGLADITGMQPMKAVLDLNFGNYLSYNDKNIKGWYDLTKEFSDKEFERIGVYAASKQSGGVERLANSGISKEAIEAIDLTPKEIEVYNYVRDVFEGEYADVKKYAQDVYNKDVGQVDNYVSYMSDYDAMSDLEIYERFGQRAEDISNLKTKTVEQGFTKARAGLSNIKLETNINKIFRRHIDDVAYMLTGGRDIKMYSEIINSPEIKAKLGDVGTMAWKQWLDLMARKGGTEGAKRIAALDVLRKNMGAGVLGFRLSSALVQFSSFADTIATVGVEWATKGAGSIATSKEWRNFVMDNFPEVKKAVGDDIAFREFGEGMLNKMARVGLTPLQYLDGLMRSSAVSGAYQKLASQKGIVVDLLNPDKQLIEGATKLMRNSQGSSFFKDQPLALTTGYGLTGNKSLNKTILTFQSFMLNRWDNIQRQIWRLGIKEKDYKKASMSVFWLLLVAPAMEEGIRRGGRALINLATGDDQKESSFVNNAILNDIQNVPIMGSLISSMTYSSNPVPVINTIEDTIGGIKSTITGKAFSTKEKGLATTMGGVGSLLGVAGASQASQIIKKAIQTESEILQNKADKEYKTLKSLPKDKAKERFDLLIKNNPELAKQINTTIEKEKLGEEGVLIKGLGVENGERAKYVFKKINELKTKEEKRVYYQELIDKGVISKKVNEQVLYLLNGSSEQITN